MALECYDRSMGGERQQDIASSLGISQAKVSRMVSRVREIVGSAGGE